MAAWIRYTAGNDLAGQPHAVDDPLAGRLADLHARHGDDVASLVRAFLAVEDVFPPALAAEPRFTEAVVDAYTTLTKQGLDGALAALGRA